MKTKTAKIDKIYRKLRKLGAKAALQDAPEDVVMGINAVIYSTKKWKEQQEGKE